MQIEMSIKGLMVDPITNMPIVILRDKDGQRVLPIWVGVFEANARRFCWVRTLIAVDLPAFERPTKAISGSSVTGSSPSALAVVRKRAVCVQARARRASASSRPAASDRAAEVAMGVLAVVVKRSL